MSDNHGNKLVERKVWDRGKVASKPEKWIDLRWVLCDRVSWFWRRAGFFFRFNCCERREDK